MYALHPHGPNTPNFFVRKSQINRFPKVDDYNYAVQVAHKGNSDIPYDARTKMRKFVVNERFCAAIAVAKANSHIARPGTVSGGAIQYYVKDSDKHKLDSKNLIDLK